MKKIKRLISLVFAAMFAFCCIANASQVSTSQVYNYVGNNIEIEISHSGWDEEKLFSIAQIIDPGIVSNTPSPCGLTCVFLGHKIQSAIAKTVIHKVYDITPRCEQSLYEVNACERCDYSEVTLIVVNAIDCCE